MKGKGYLTGIGGLILIGAVIWGGWHWYAYLRYAPKVNPHPQYFMTIKGHIDPGLQKTLKLQWVATYYSTNPACEVWPGGQWNEGGVKEPRAKNIDYRPNIDKAGNYILKIPIDYYYNGYCHWVPISIDFNLQDFGDQTIALFMKDGNKKINIHAHSKILCDKSKNRNKIICKQLIRDDLSSNLKVGLGNYHYSLNILEANNAKNH